MLTPLYYVERAFPENALTLGFTEAGLFDFSFVKVYIREMRIVNYACTACTSKLHYGKLYFLSKADTFAQLVAGAGAEVAVNMLQGLYMVDNSGILMHQGSM